MCHMFRTSSSFSQLFFIRNEMKVFEGGGLVELVKVIDL